MLDHDINVSFTKWVNKVIDAEIELTNYREHSPFYSQNGEKVHEDAVDNAWSDLRTFVAAAIELKGK